MHLTTKNDVSKCRRYYRYFLGKIFIITTLEKLKIYHGEILSLTNSIITIMYVLSRNKSVFCIFFTKIGLCPANRRNIWTMDTDGVVGHHANTFFRFNPFAPTRRFTVA